ncbi:MAG: HAMP domain-containing histidine kinase [Clostridia bacterium]|nr:HAMP domain-containing histidine kinase [Clostridia bacterium]
MRMKFFERTYLLTFILFLVFLNVAVFALAMYTYSNSTAAAESVCNTEMLSIADAFEKDYDYAGSASAHILQVTYGNFYNKKGIKLQFLSEGNVSYSSLPEGIDIPKEGKLANTKTAGKRYIVISRKVCDDTFTLVYAKDVSYLDTEFRSLCIVFVSGSVLASLLLGVVLYFILRKLYLPLIKLRDATGSIANGNFSVRADDNGDDEVSALAKDFNIMADKVSQQICELKDTADRRQRMLDNLAHEMRTPLTAIHGYAEYICGAKIPHEERVDAAQYIMSESMRLKDISETLLDSAFIRENGIDPKPVSLRGLAYRTCTRLVKIVKERGVTLTCEAEEITVNGDEVLLDMLLSNLIENAAKACTGSGTVTVGTVKREGIVSLFVRDNGMGMTEEQLSHITEPFYRTDKSRSRTQGGTGLGLALCKGIAEAHGATLEFSSRQGDGTTAFLNFTTSLQDYDNSITKP